MDVDSLNFLYTDAGYKEKIMCDLHLNSALNIDPILHEEGLKLDYNMVADVKWNRSKKRCFDAADYFYNTMNPEAQNFNSVCPSDRLSHVGSILEKLKLSHLDHKFDVWYDKEIEIVMNHLGYCLDKRGIKNDFKKFSNLLANQSLHIPKNLLVRFEYLMYTIMQVSELLRFGSNRVSDDLIISENVVMLASKYLQLDIWLVTDGTIVLYISNEVGITTWEDLLACIDTIGQRLCLYLSHSCAKITTNPGFIGQDILTEVITIMDTVLAIEGNYGYRIVGMFESIVVSSILVSNKDSVADKDAFRKSVWEELEGIIESESRTLHDNLGVPKIKSDPNRVRELCIQMINVLDNLPPDSQSNIFCIYRIWGHPYVDIKEGLGKVFDIGTKDKPSSKILPRLMSCTFKEHFLNWYYKKNSRYPNLKIKGTDTDIKGSYILRSIATNSPIKRKAAGYIIEDYMNVELRQVFMIPQTYDLSHILNDKAVSPSKSEIIRRIQEGKTLEGMEGRRGVLRWLEKGTQLSSDFLQDINDNGINDDELIIGMYEKEREMKNAARMFALMSESMRYYFVLTEEMIADHILPAFPQITMKDSLNTLQKKLWIAGSNYKKMRFNVNINIDFAKWNTNMRGDIVNPVFENMDNILGYTNLISRTHEIFRLSTIYSCSGKYQPMIGKDGELMMDPPMCYRGHQGGMEGLRQKGWTVATVCLIDYVARKCKVDYKLMGSGDNQIIKVIMQTWIWESTQLTEEEMSNEARRVVDKFIYELVRAFDEVGLPIKSRECWVSARLFMYAKSMLLDDSVLAQWTKKLLRSYAMTNEGILTLGGTIGTISTNCTSSASTMTEIDLGYAMYLLLCGWTLRFFANYHPFAQIKNPFSMSGEIELTKGVIKRYNPIRLLEAFTAICLIPSSAGGSTNIPWTSYIIRGFPDPVSEAYSWIKLLSEGNCDIITKVSQSFYSYIRPHEIRDYTLLINSPLSINHVKVATPTLAAKKETLSFLIDNYKMKNKVIHAQDLINTHKELQFDYTQMMTDPFNPLIAHEISLLDPYYIISDLVSRVQTTRTIKKATIQSDSVDIVKRVREAEIKFIEYILYRVRSKGEIYDTCATSQVRQMRNIGWGREIVGVTTPHPLEFTCEIPDCKDPFMCTEPSDFVYIRKDDHLRYPPYLGSKVSTKVISTQDPLLRKEPLISQASRIYRLATWLGLEAGHMSLIQDLVRSYVPDEILNVLNESCVSSSAFSGAVDHRLNSDIMADGCFINYAPQVGSKIFLSSDYMNNYGRGSTNYTLSFQAIYGWVQYITAMEPGSFSKHFHLPCTRCIVPVNTIIPPIENIPWQCNPDISEILHTMYPIDISKIHHLRNDNPTQTAKLDTNCDIIDIPKRFIRISITIVLALQVAHDIYFDKEDDSGYFSIDTVDLQKYPRIYAYKVLYSDLIKYTSYFLLYLGCIIKQFGFDGVGIYRAKRFIVDKVLYAAQTQIKGLASLCIERNMSCEQEGSSTGEGGIYPETITEKCNIVSASLRREINKILNIGNLKLPGCIVIPSEDLHPTQFNLLLGIIETTRYNDSKLYEYVVSGYLEPRDRFPIEDFYYKKYLKHIRVPKTTLSRLGKMLEALPIRPWKLTQEPLVVTPTTEDVQISDKIEKKLGGLFIYNKSHLDIEFYKEITLPTAAAYKWSEVMSSLPDKKNYIVLGDGTGTTSYIIAKHHPDSIIYPASYLEYSDITPQDSTALAPTISRRFSNVRQDIILYCESDINTETWAIRFKGIIESLGVDDVCIVSDIEMEGGSILSSPAIRQILRLGPICFFKCYMREVLSSDALKSLEVSSISLTVAFTGNLRYNEVFLTITPCETSHSWTDMLDMYNKYENICDGINAYDQKSKLNLITLSLPYLVCNNDNLMIREIEKLGFQVQFEDLSLPWNHLLMKLLVYINTHYYFFTQSRERDGKRSMTIRKRKQCEHLFQIFLYATLKEEPDMSLLPSLKIIHKRSGIIDKYPYNIMPSIIYGYQNNLSKKHIQCYLSLRNKRRRLAQDLRDKCNMTYGETCSESQESILGFLTKGVKTLDIYYYTISESSSMSESIIKSSD